MRFDFAAFRRALPADLSPSLSTALAAAGTSLATLMIGYVVLFGGGKTEADAEIRANTVAVRGPVFTPVVTTPAVARIDRPSAVSPGAVVQPMTGDAQDLTRSVQTALKRAGCYQGGIDGVWAGQTSAAMEAFTIRVNARLPVDKPDAVLLALVETHDDVSCAVEAFASPVDASRLETGSIETAVERGTPTMRREAIMTRDVVLSSSATFETHGRAEHLSYADETQPASKTAQPLAHVATASVGGNETAAAGSPKMVPAPVVRVPKAAKRERPRRASRRARNKPPSFSRSVSRSFRSISRTMNRLF
ncbi:hypothetical protein W911_00085 [Hyphomicrobium nitrativorans NL23]|uniref:Peptidoglycan binding-like domain-containing protein n=1 Tax=Hyphomicrobium nitrativorans NL23 TaxID=1029756 RepID=V5SIK1_9HYPH|nr:hypothetical protein [Hyphomicrobium nitrativorans]AHB49779.1 hypothetical protein W911_00085 [Hyphomicrobium nitrativorans NL23]